MRLSQNEQWLSFQRLLSPPVRPVSRESLTNDAGHAAAPPGSALKPVMLGDKVLADVMESLIGAFYMTNGELDAALAFMNWAGK